MGEEQRVNVFPIFLEEREIGDNDIDAHQLRVGEHHAAVDDDDVVAVAQGHAVHPEFAEAAERDYLQLPFCHRWKVKVNTPMRWTADGELF